MKRWAYLLISLQILIGVFSFTPQAFAAEVQIYGRIGVTEDSTPRITEPESSKPALAKPTQKYLQTKDLPKAGSVNGRMAAVGYGLLIVLLLLLVWKTYKTYKQDKQ